jgi:hypothetical protein
MSAHGFIFELLGLAALLSFALLSGPIATATVSFFYGTVNRRGRK